jgi:hypothetical protein
MPRVDITIVKGAAADRIEFRRQDGSGSHFHFPKKGPIPHDVVHLLVEEALGLRRGFWGMVADGADPAAVQDIAKAAGHASAKRAKEPDPQIIEILQAERIVECFEADLWSGPSDLEAFRSVAAAACAASFVDCPSLDDATITTVRERLAAFSQKWIAAANGAEFTFQFLPE